MKDYIVQFFTWWNGQTLNGRFNTWRHGEKVGTDEAGNVYYRTRGGAIDPALGLERRWVLYNGVAEASRIPPGLVWLDASPRRRAADRGALHAAGMAEAASSQSDRHAARLSPPGLNAVDGPTPLGHRRLQGLDARRIASRRPFFCPQPRANRRLGRGPSMPRVAD